MQNTAIRFARAGLRLQALQECVAPAHQAGTCRELPCQAQQSACSKEAHSNLLLKLMTVPSWRLSMPCRKTCVQRKVASILVCQQRLQPASVRSGISPHPNIPAQLHRQSTFSSASCPSASHEYLQHSPETPGFNGMLDSGQPWRQPQTAYLQYFFQALRGLYCGKIEGVDTAGAAGSCSSNFTSCLPKFLLTDVQQQQSGRSGLTESDRDCPADAA